MKRFTLLVLPLTLALVASVDTTGLSAESSREPAGNPDAAVVVTEYADLECPACRAAHANLTKPLLEKYGNQIRFEMMHFPLRNIHRFALDLAEASECAADQEKFWEFVDLAYENQQELDQNAIDEWARELGLDTDLFGRCVDSHIKRDLILESYDQGRSLGVQGTPTYFVNGQQTEATITGLSAAIDQALSGAGQRL